MRNLAGVTTAHADAYIEDELNEARIPYYQDKVSDGEVKYSLRGSARGRIFGDFELTRAWDYWVVQGPVPVELAWELYNDPRGKTDVRVAGHCACPEPKAPWTRSVDGKEYVTEYHIDTQDGLNLFAERVFGTRPLPPTDEEKEVAKEIARNNHSGRIIYEDSPTESEYLGFQKDVQKIRKDLSSLRGRLEDLHHDTASEVANTAAHLLTGAIHILYELEDPADGRSFIRGAMVIRKMWDDLYANPNNYVLKESP